MDNPFVYGEVVPPAAFVDREQELERLTGDLLAGQKVFLISPRRYGKSSLVQQALRAAAKRGALAVALDEFQAIQAFDEGSHEIEHALRASIQHQRQVGYVFSGSEPSLMERMLSRSRPFYKAGPVLRLERIPAEQFAAFLETKFQ